MKITSLSDPTGPGVHLKHLLSNLVVLHGQGFFLFSCPSPTVYRLVEYSGWNHCVWWMCTHTCMHTRCVYFKRPHQYIILNSFWPLAPGMVFWKVIAHLGGGGVRYNEIWPKGKNFYFILLFWWGGGFWLLNKPETTSCETIWFLWCVYIIGHVGHPRSCFRLSWWAPQRSKQSFSIRWQTWPMHALWPRVTCI